MTRWFPLTVVAVSLAACGGTPAPIDEALGHCDSRLPKKQTEDWGDLRKVTVDTDHGHCNDGSPPLLYIRPATDPSHANDWVIWFEGGGECTNYTSCMTRWCGIGPYNANGMSSRFRGPTMLGEGILDPAERNAFAGWNAVAFRYCTSDGWIGTQTEPVELSGMLTTITLPFEGHLVVESFLDALAAGVTSDDGTMTAPPLVDARTILVSGESAGGMGAIQHVDQIAERFADAEVVGVIDGFETPSPEAVPTQLAGAVRKANDQMWKQRFGLWSPLADAGCTTDDGDCLSVPWLLENAIETPLVMRVDLRDPVLSDLYAGTLTMDQWASGIEATLERLAEERTDSAFVATRCSRHVVATSDLYFGLEAADHGEGTAYTLQDAVESFVLRDRRVVAIEDPNGSTVCGEARADRGKGRRRADPPERRERRRGRGAP